MPNSNIKQRPVGDSTIPSSLALEHGTRPSWLLSDYDAPCWIVTDIGAKRNRKISFDLSLPGGRQLGEFRTQVDSIKRIVYGVRTGPLMDVESGSVQADIAANLRTLTRWMIGNDIRRYEGLRISDVEEYAELAVFGTYSVLDAETLLSRHIERLISKAKFNESDSPADRFAKFLKVFPAARGGSVGEEDRLDRFQILNDAGLGGLGVGSGAGNLARMLDRLEEQCGCVLTKRIRDRLQSDAIHDEYARKPVTEEHLRRFLMSFQYLYLHRRYLEDAMQIAPFPVSSPRMMARRLGREVGRTRNIPMPQAMTMIERSVRWVVDYGPSLLAIKDRRDLLFDQAKPVVGHSVGRGIKKFEDSPGSPFPILPGVQMSWPGELLAKNSLAKAVLRRAGMTLPTALNFLMASCAVVIATFSARRAAEILGLKAGCIERDDSGKPWMRIFIHKTTWLEEMIPVPEVVASAVALLERLSLRAREDKGSPYIFQYNLPGSERAVGLSSDGMPAFGLAKFLQEFGYFIDVPALEDGSRWKFNPHQFRRFFAILYVWIYELGDWGALSYHLRHFNPEMTRRYVSDGEIGQIISVADREHTAQILANAALGHVTLSGASGQRLTLAARRLHEQMNRQVLVVSEAKFQSRLLRFVERADVTLRALPWGYCATSSKVGKSQAPKCAPDKNVPNPGAATVSTCRECRFSVRSANFLPYLDSSIRIHRDIAKAKDTPPILRNASEAISRELDEYIRSLAPSGKPKEEGA